MQEKYIWIGLVLLLGIGIIGWNAVTPLNQSAYAPKAREAPQVRAMPASLPQMASPRLAPSATEEATLDVQIDQLIASHDPEKAYAAYWLIANCETFNREHDRLVYDIEEVTQNRNMVPYRGMSDNEKQHEAKLCSGMTERMRLLRFDYLATAAKAGVSGAAVQMAEEGPFGDRTALATRPDDPLVQEWKAKMLNQLTKEAERGDLLTLNYLWMHSLTGDALIAKDPALAYRYAVALGLIEGDLKGPKALEASTYAPEGQLLTSIIDLNPEQRKAERAAAQRIADNARELRLKQPAAAVISAAK